MNIGMHYEMFVNFVYQKMSGMHVSVSETKRKMITSRNL